MAFNVKTLIWPWVGGLEGSLGYILYLSYVKLDKASGVGGYKYGEWLFVVLEEIQSETTPGTRTSTWESSMLLNWKLDWVTNLENTKDFNEKFKWGQGVVSEVKDLSIPDLGLNRPSIRFSVLAVFRGSVTGQATRRPYYNQCKPLWATSTSFVWRSWWLRGLKGWPRGVIVATTW